MSEESDIRTSLRVAFRHFNAKDTSEAERDSILSAMVARLGGQEGELASRMLHNRRDNAAMQLELTLRLDAPPAPHAEQVD